MSKSRKNPTDASSSKVVRGRSQTKSVQTGVWARKTASGRFMDLKTSGGTFKGVKRER